MDQNTQPSYGGGESNDMTMAILAYILFFIPLLLVKDRSAFLNYHINQGLNLFIVAVAGSAIFGVLGWRFAMFTNIWSLLMIILLVLGIINASKNEMKPLPVIGNLFNFIK